MKMFALLLLIGTLWAQGNTEYEVYHAATPITMDGQADEPAWTSAVNLPSSSASSKILWDDTYLYVFFSCTDEAVCGQPMPERTQTVNECLTQLQISPDPQHTDAYLGFRVSRSAEVSAYVSFGGTFLFRNLHTQGVKVSVYQSQESSNSTWSMEMAIPWTNFSDLNRKHGAGETWKARLGCMDETAPSVEFRDWKFIP